MPEYTDKRVPLRHNYKLRITGSNGTFTVDKEIGRGGSCLAYIGTRNDTKQKVIIKEFYPHIVQSGRDDNNYTITHNNDAEKKDFDNRLELFKKGIEKHIDAYNADSNFVLESLNCSGYANNTFYAVYLKSSGTVLSSIDLEKLKIVDAIEIAISICNAIKSIHTCQKLYLDCKPDNIMVYNDNKAKLFDFDTVLEVLNLQAGAYISYSAGYSAPEQDNTRQHINPSDIGFHTDIYSVGATFFYTLTGHCPTDDDITKIQSVEFDWEHNIINKDSSELSSNDEFIKLLSSIMKMVLQQDFKIRKLTFEVSEPSDSIVVLIDQLQKLHNCAKGDIPAQIVKEQNDILNRKFDETRKDGKKFRKILLPILVVVAITLLITVYYLIVIQPSKAKEALESTYLNNQLIEKETLESTYLKNQVWADATLKSYFDNMGNDFKCSDIKEKINLTLFWDNNINLCRIAFFDNKEEAYAQDETSSITSFEDIVRFFPNLEGLYIYNIQVPNIDENGEMQLSCLKELKNLKKMRLINCGFYNREALPSGLDVEIQNSIFTGEWSDQTLKAYFDDVEPHVTAGGENSLYYYDFQSRNENSLAINLIDINDQPIREYFASENTYKNMSDTSGKSFDSVKEVAHEYFKPEADVKSISSFEDFVKYFPNLETLIIYNANLPNEDKNGGKQYSSLLELKNLKYVEFVNCNFTNLSALKNVDEVVINNGTNFSTEKFVPGEFMPEEISIDCNGNFYFMRSYKKGESLVDRLSFYYELDDGTFNNKYRIITNDFSRKFPGTRSLYCCGCEFVDENGLKENTISFDNFSNLERLKLKKCDVALTPKVPPYVEVLCIDNQQNNNSLYGELAFKDLLKSSSLSALELKYFKNIDFHEAENNKQLDIISISDCSFDESTLGEAKNVTWLEIESSGLVRYNSKKLVNSIKECLYLHKLVFRNIDFSDCTDGLFDSLRILNSLFDLSIPYCVLETTKPFASFETKIARLDVTGIMTLKSDNSNGGTISREYNFYYLRKYRQELSPENFLYSQGVDFDSEYPPDIIN